MKRHSTCAVKVGYHLTHVPNMALYLNVTVPTGTGMIIAAYPLFPPMLLHHKASIYMPISNFHCEEQS